MSSRTVVEAAVVHRRRRRRRRRKNKICQITEPAGGMRMTVGRILQLESPRPFLLKKEHAESESVRADRLIVC